MTDASQPGKDPGIRAALAEANSALRDQADEMAALSGKSRARRVWEYLSGALTDAKTGQAVLSIGRVSWLVWFAQATYLWQRAAPGVDPISSSQLIIGGSLLAYITGSTIKEVLVARISGGAKG